MVKSQNEDGAVRKRRWSREQKLTKHKVVMAEMGEEQNLQNTKFSSPKSLEKEQLLILLVGGLL